MTKPLLDSLLYDQGILLQRNIRLLCFPDYLFFRTHNQKLYREFEGFPRYSIIARKYTEDQSNDTKYKSPCYLRKLYIIDGSSALINAPFFFPISKKINLSIVGTNLNFVDVVRFRESFKPIYDFIPFHPYTVNIFPYSKPETKEESSFDSNAVSLPLNFYIRYIKGNNYFLNTIAIGCVRSASDFFPNGFELLRVNLGDLLEYKQSYFDESKKNFLTKHEITLIELKRLINIFKIPVILVSLYKLAKFVNVKGVNRSLSPEGYLRYIMHTWNFSEALILFNEKGRKWDQIHISKLNNYYDEHGYVVFFNR
ncbi:hypothetical protein [Candidatus Hodarchaeum mangrovi]